MTRKSSMKQGQKKKGTGKWRGYAMGGTVMGTAGLISLHADRAAAQAGDERLSVFRGIPKKWHIPLLLFGTGMGALTGRAIQHYYRRYKAQNPRSSLAAAGVNAAFMGAGPHSLTGIPVTGILTAGRDFNTKFRGKRYGVKGL